MILEIVERRMHMNMEKMKAVFADEAFIKQLFELETAAQVQAAL